MKYTIVPNIERVLIRPVSKSQSSGIELIPGQLKAGENLFFGEVIHPGNTKFVKGQRVYYSEYSASALFPLGAVERGEITYGEALKSNQFIVVAADDIMAYEEEDNG